MRTPSAAVRLDEFVFASATTASVGLICASIAMNVADDASGDDAARAASHVAFDAFGPITATSVVGSVKPSVTVCPPFSASVNVS